MTELENLGWLVNFFSLESELKIQTWLFLHNHALVSQRQLWPLFKRKEGFLLETALLPPEAEGCRQAWRKDWPRCQWSRLHLSGHQMRAIRLHPQGDCPVSLWGLLASLPHSLHLSSAEAVDKYRRHELVDMRRQAPWLISIDWTCPGGWGNYM